MSKEKILSRFAYVKSLENNDSEMEKINKFTQEKLNAEDVYVFKVMMCDNEQDDRNFMPFNRKSLDDMAELYVGKTMMKDHEARTDNQIARVYDTEIVEDTEKLTELGEAHAELYAKVYMLNNDLNKDTIASIKAGIKKEVSTSSMPDKLICSECGTDQLRKYCSHFPGVTYKKDSQPCKFLIDGVKECYELSFVAIPAQPRAGVSKFTKLFEPETEEQEVKKDANSDIDIRLRLAKNFIEMEKMKNE